jgi:ribonucleoside-diphosphate reductase alpha chain
MAMSQFSIEEMFMLKTLKKIFDMQHHLKLISEELNRENYLGSYSSFEGSPLSKGQLQYDMWNEALPKEFIEKFAKLKAEMAQYGMRNSTLFAYMPTATTAQIQGNNECFEPYTSNLYNRNVLSGSFIVTNRHLVDDLMKLGLWNNEMKNKIIEDKGSIQNIPEIPNDIKKLYKIVWEISQKVILEYARDRAPFVCMTQSMNLFVDTPNTAKLTSMHFYGWELGLKTGMYYLRTRAKVTAQQFTIETKENVKTESDSKNYQDFECDSKSSQPRNEYFECDRSNPDCLACGS